MSSKTNGSPVDSADVVLNRAGDLAHGVVALMETADSLISQLETEGHAESARLVRYWKVSTQCVLYGLLLHLAWKAVEALSEEAPE